MTSSSDGPTVSNILHAGEYGATKVEVTKDGSMTRIAFGRNQPARGDGIFYSAVLLSPEAIESLKAQLEDI